MSIGKLLALVLLCTLTTSCYIDQDLFSETGGDPIPLNSGDMLVCASYDHEGKGNEPTTYDVHAVTVHKKVLYTAMTRESTVLYVFHRVTDDVYIAVVANDDNNDQYLLVARATNSSLTFFHYTDHGFVNEAAKTHNVVPPAIGVGRIEGTPRNKKEFLYTLARNVNKATVLVECKRHSKAR